MIKGISQGGRYITVIGGSPGSNYVNNFSGAQGIGNMRFNTTNQNIEIYDGVSWQTLQSSYASIQLDEEAIRILDWARDKRHQEMELESLSNDHPAVKAAYENVRRAKEQLATTIILSKNESTTN